MHDEVIKDALREVLAKFCLPFWMAGTCEMVTENRMQMILGAVKEAGYVIVKSNEVLDLREAMLPGGKIWQAEEVTDGSEGW